MDQRGADQRGAGLEGGPCWDAVVVGAGPAGSVAALVLARAGARVALVDKAAFPRDKACGDLVGPRGVRVLDELCVAVPDAGRGSDLLVAGPSGRRVRLPAFPGRTYAGHGLIVPRTVLDDALRAAALAAGAVAVRARVTGAEAVDGPAPGPGARLGPGTGTGPGPGLVPRGAWRALVTSDGQCLRGRAFIGADGAVSQVARLAGLVDPGAALWGFAIRGYVPAEVQLPLLALLDAAPWRIFPGYGWLFPGACGLANVGIGVGMGGRRARAGLRDDLERLCARLSASGDLAPGARPGRVIGGWLRMGGAGTAPGAGNVLLAGDAAGLINPLQGEGIAAAMISGRLAARAVLATYGRSGGRSTGSGGGRADAAAESAGAVYSRAIGGVFGQFYGGAAAMQLALLRHPRLASMAMRTLTTAPVGRLVAGTWSLYWNGLADGAQPRPSASGAAAVQRAAGHLAYRSARQPPGPWPDG